MSIPSSQNPKIRNTINWRNQLIIFGAAYSGSLAYFFAKTFNVLPKRENMWRAADLYWRPLIPFYDRCQAIQEVANHKLSIKDWTIWSVYGVFNKEGIELAEPEVKISFPDYEDGKKTFNVSRSGAVKEVSHLFRYIHYCYNSSDKYKCLEPIEKAEAAWKREEVENMSLGHIHKPNFKAAVPFEELSEELKNQIPYYASVYRIAMDFTARHKQFELAESFTDLSEMYYGPNSNTQIVTNGGIGVDSGYFKPTRLMTPWGSFEFYGPKPNNKQYYKILDVNYGFNTKVPFSQMENCRFVPWSWGGPIESLSEDFDHNKLPEIEFSHDVKCSKKIAEDWNKIRDHVLKKACEPKKV